MKINPTVKQNPQTTPVKIGFLMRLKKSISKIVHNMPSRIPICEPKPSDRSMVKNKTAQNGDPGSSTIACVKTMNANPVPSAAFESISFMSHFPKPQSAFCVLFKFKWLIISSDTISDMSVLFISP